MAGGRGRRDKGYGFSRTSLRRLVRLRVLRRLALLQVPRRLVSLWLVPAARSRRRSAKTTSAGGWGLRWWGQACE
jgi:hypothetical protein